MQEQEQKANIKKSEAKEQIIKRAKNFIRETPDILEDYKKSFIAELKEFKELLTTLHLKKTSLYILKIKNFVNNIKEKTDNCFKKFNECESLFDQLIVNKDDKQMMKEIIDDENNGLRKIYMDYQKLCNQYTDFYWNAVNTRKKVEGLNNQEDEVGEKEDFFKDLITDFEEFEKKQTDELSEKDQTLEKKHQKENNTTTKIPAKIINEQNKIKHDDKKNITNKANLKRSKAINKKTNKPNFVVSGKEGEKYYQKNTAFDTKLDKPKTKKHNAGLYWNPSFRREVRNYQFRDFGRGDGRFMNF